MAEAEAADARKAEAEFEAVHKETAARKAEMERAAVSGCSWPRYQ